MKQLIVYALLCSLIGQVVCDSTCGPPMHQCGGSDCEPKALREGAPNLPDANSAVAETFDKNPRRRKFFLMLLYLDFGKYFKE